MPFLASSSLSRSQAGTHAKTHGLILAPVPVIYFGHVASLQQNRSDTRNKNGRQQNNSVIFFSEGYDFSEHLLCNTRQLQTVSLGSGNPSVSDVSSV